MNKRERVTAAFKGLETDHVAVSMWKHVPSEFWGDDDRFAQEQARFLHSTDVDFMKLSGDKFFGWPAPVLKDIENASSLLWMKPLGPNHPYIRGQIDADPAQRYHTFRFPFVFDPDDFAAAYEGIPSAASELSPGDRAVLVYKYAAVPGSFAVQKTLQVCRET